MTTVRTVLVTGFALFAVSMSTPEYPIDGYKITGIRRLERLRLRLAGEISGPVPVPGGRKLFAEIGLTLNHAPGDSLFRSADTAWSLPEIDPDFASRIQRILAGRNPNYSIAVMDITPGRPVRFAAHRADAEYSPGSVGKIAIAVGVFTELARLFPTSIDDRIRRLRTRTVTAGRWIHRDDHEVVIYNPETREVEFRPIREGDRFSLYEWIDHMLAPSSNAAASTVWKEAILMRHFGVEYPPDIETEEAFFRDTPRAELTRMAVSIVNDPLRAFGISAQDWRLGSMFTGAGKSIVPGSGGSGSSVRGLMTFLMRLEQGKVLDPWTSLELKRLLYQTEKRIRYASSPRLNDSAVYFKSGSLYSCIPGTRCAKYMGTRANYMNSVAIVEKPDGTTYMTVLMSNILEVNSAVEHQTIATFIDRVVSQTN